jgi:8-amino-7-oxononanoate synthase
MTAGTAGAGDIRIDSDDYSLADFTDSDSPDLFEVTKRFWAFVQDVVAKKAMVYGCPNASAPAAEIQVYDRYQDRIRKFLNFCSYNYLGYSLHPAVKSAIKDAVDKYGTGAVAAPLLGGTYDTTTQLEAAIARFKHKEAAVVFATGYGTNLGVLSAILKPNDVAVVDALCHASIYDGIRLSGAGIKPFCHNNARHLKKVLGGVKGKRCIVCVEGLYSMDGDLCDLPAIVSIARDHGAKILLDEAHSTLVFGKSGRGVAEHFGVEKQIDLTIGTFSKAFGAIGGYVVGEQKLMSYIHMYARSYVFSCAMAPHTAAGILKVLDLFQTDMSRRDRLLVNAAYLRDGLTAAKLDIGNSVSHVIPVMCGSDTRLREISRRIMAQGLCTGIVTYPAVSNKKTRLRLSVSSEHTQAQLDQCARIIKEAMDGTAD